MAVKAVAVAGLAVALSACGSMATRVALDPAAKQKLQDVRVVNIVAQDEIVMRAESIGAPGGGLLGAVIGSKVDEGRQNTIQELIAPFYASVDNYDFRPRLTEALSGVLGEGATAKFGAIEPSSAVSMAELTARQRALTGQQGLMNIRTSYTFTPDYRTLMVTTNAGMGVAGTEQPAYLNTFYYVSAPVGNGGADSLRVWSENQGGRYREAANEAAKQVAAMLKLDLAASATDPAGLPTIPMPAIPGWHSGAGIKVPVLQTQAGRSIVRVANGHLYSIAQ